MTTHKTIAHIPHCLPNETVDELTRIMEENNNFFDQEEEYLFHGTDFHRTVTQRGYDGGVLFRFALCLNAPDYFYELANHYTIPDGELLPFIPDFVEKLRKAGYDNACIVTVISATGLCITPKLASLLSLTDAVYRFNPSRHHDATCDAIMAKNNDFMRHDKFDSEQFYKIYNLHKAMVSIEDWVSYAWAHSLIHMLHGILTSEVVEPNIAGFDYKKGLHKFMYNVPARYSKEMVLSMLLETPLVVDFRIMISFKLVDEFSKWLKVNPRVNLDLSNFTRSSAGRDTLIRYLSFMKNRGDFESNITGSSYAEENLEYLKRCFEELPTSNPCKQTLAYYIYGITHDNAYYHASKRLVKPKTK